MISVHHFIIANVQNSLSCKWLLTIIHNQLKPLFPDVGQAAILEAEREEAEHQKLVAENERVSCLTFVEDEQRANFR